MTKYAVIFEAVAQHIVEVDAETEDEATTLAWEDGDFPYFPGSMGGDLSDWEFVDVEEI